MIWISYNTWQGISIQKDIDEIKTILKSSDCGAQSAEIKKMMHKLSDMKKAIAEMNWIELSDGIGALGKKIKALENDNAETIKVQKYILSDVSEIKMTLKFELSKDIGTLKNDTAELKKCVVLL